MSRLIPIAIAVVAIAALTFVEGSMTERWGDSRLCAYCVTLLDEVPMQIGDWSGTDQEVTAETQEVAGARGFVNRTYRNSNGDAVGVWLIVGHARDTADHVPTICYAASGFKGGSSKRRASMPLDNGTTAQFFTAKFYKPTEIGELYERVFWTWHHPRLGSEQPVAWVAPDNLRAEIAAAPALFKLYFTTSGSAAEAVEESICLEFAKEFYPVVNAILTRANDEIPADFDASKVAEI